MHLDFKNDLCRDLLSLCSYWFYTNYFPLISIHNQHFPPVHWIYCCLAYRRHNFFSRTSQSLMDIRLNFCYFWLPKKKNASTLMTLLESEKSGKTLKCYVNPKVNLILLFSIASSFFSNMNLSSFLKTSHFTSFNKTNNTLHFSKIIYFSTVVFH